MCKNELSYNVEIGTDVSDAEVTQRKCEIGCKVFESVGIPVQETNIGTYTNKGKEKIVVACKDFTSQGITLQDFASLKNRIIDSERNGISVVKA